MTMGPHHAQPSQRGGQDWKSQSKSLEGGERQKNNKIRSPACRISEQFLLPQGCAKLFFMEEQACDVWMGLGGLREWGWDIYLSVRHHVLPRRLLPHDPPLPWSSL